MDEDLIKEVERLCKEQCFTLVFSDPFWGAIRGTLQNPGYYFDSLESLYSFLKNNIDI